MTKAEAIPVQVLRYPELQNKTILEMVMKDDLCLPFIPDNWSKKNAKISRKYLWLVLNTKRPFYTYHLIRHANEQRDKDNVVSGADIQMEVNQ